MASIRKRVGKPDENDKPGKTTYLVEIRLKGYPHQRATFEKLTDAKRWANQTESAIKEGRYFKTTEAKRHTLADLIDRYIEKVLIPTKPGQIIHQKPQLKWFKERIGYLVLADVTTAALIQCRDDLQEETTNQGKTRGPSTINRYFAALGHAFTVAVNEWEWLETNPVSRMKKQKESDGRVRYLDEDELKRLLAACESSSHSMIKTIVLITLTTGMRKTEVLNLFWKEPKQPPTGKHGNVEAWGVIHQEQSKIVLHKTKNGNKRVIPLSSKVMDALREHGKVRRLDSDYVFPSENGKHSIDIRNVWEDVRAKAQLEDFRFHDLRHTTASHLAMNGASLAELAEILGHKTLQMVKRYAHLSDSHVAGVLERMNSKVFGE